MTVKVVAGKPPREIPDEAKALFHRKLDEALNLYEWSDDHAASCSAGYCSSQAPGVNLRIILEEWA